MVLREKMNMEKMKEKTCRPPTKGAHTLGLTFFATQASTHDGRTNTRSGLSFTAASNSLSLLCRCQCDPWETNQQLCQSGARPCLPPCSPVALGDDVRRVRPHIIVDASPKGHDVPPHPVCRRLLDGCE
jgi:hypothetical protein